MMERECSMSCQKKEFAENLLEWWQNNKRDFPWRKTTDAYKILIAEVLLRKTTAKQVDQLYTMFLSKYPNPHALSETSIEDIESTIKPLGMQHKRAMLLKSLGSDLFNKYSGKIPASKKELMVLPGVGLYVANAVLCFAYGKDVPIVDTNVIRVFQRVFNFQSKKRRPKDDLELWNFVSSCIPSRRAKEFNLAILDHAHSICVPRNPHCPICPLNAICKYATSRKQ